MPPLQGFARDPASVIRHAVHEHWRLYMAEAVLLIVLGLAAMLVPAVAGLAATVILGWLFLIAGAAGIAFSVMARGAPGFIWSLLSAVLALVVGGLLAWNPLQGLMTLTLVLTAFFAVDGVLMIVLALAHRRELVGRWEWVLANGAMDLVLAVLILLGLPGSLVWALGILVGIDMVFAGGSLFAMAAAARKEQGTGR
jgi:uncharacterized membrane protein HdeD (DUF308 family)